MQDVVCVEENTSVYAGGNIKEMELVAAKVCQSYYIFHESIIPINLMYILKLIFKIIRFISFEYKLFLFKQARGTRSGNINGMDNESEHIILIICAYLNLVKNQWIYL